MLNEEINTLKPEAVRPYCCNKDHLTGLPTGHNFFPKKVYVFEHLHQHLSMHWVLKVFKVTSICCQLPGTKSKWIGSYLPEKKLLYPPKFFTDKVIFKFFINFFSKFNTILLLLVPGIWRHILITLNSHFSMSPTKGWWGGSTK